MMAHFKSYGQSRVFNGVPLFFNRDLEQETKQVKTEMISNGMYPQEYRDRWHQVIWSEKESFSSRSASRLISLLDHYDHTRSKHCLACIGVVPSVESLLLGHKLFVQFLRKAESALRRDLSLLGLELIIDWHHLTLENSDNCLRIQHAPREIVADSNSKPSSLNGEDHEWLIGELQRKLQRRDAYDFEQLNREVLTSATKTIAFIQQVTGDVLDKSKVIQGQKLYTSDATDESLQFTAEHEWNYSASSSGLVLFPDANRFTDEHWKYWREVRRRHRIGCSRLNRDYEFRVITLFHEIVHCFQGHKWKFEGFGLWQAEFEASYCQLDLLHLAANVVDCERDVWRDGFAEESMLWMFDLVHEIHLQIPECDRHIVTGYETWLNSHGRLPPIHQSSDELFDQNKCWNTYLKNRLPLEAYSEGRRIPSYFRYRWNSDTSVKDAYNMGHSVPDDLLIEQLQFKLMVNEK